MVKWNDMTKHLVFDGTVAQRPAFLKSIEMRLHSLPWPLKCPNEPCGYEPKIGMPLANYDCPNCGTRILTW